MKNKLAIFCALVFLSSCFVTPTVSPPITPTVVSPIITPTPTPTPIPPPPRVPIEQTAPLTFRNGDFERPYTVRAPAEIVAQYWYPWHDDVPPCKPSDAGCLLKCPTNCGTCTKSDLGCWWASPEWSESYYTDYGGFRVHTGQSAQKMFVYGRQGNPKLYQQVDVFPSSVITFSVWLMGWQCFDINMCNLAMLNTAKLPNGSPNPIYNPVRVQYLLSAWGCSSFKACASRAISDRPYHLNIRVGIDTMGTISPTASSMVWSNYGESFDVWSKFTITATTRANRITLWIEDTPTFDYIRYSNDLYSDSASLEVYFPYKYLYFPFIGKQK